MNKISRSYFLFFIITFCYSCNIHKQKPNGFKYAGTWVVYNTIRLKFDTAQILKANDSIYSYHPYGADTSRLKLSKEENLVDSEDSTFVIRFNNKTDQLIMKNIRNGEDLYVNRLK
ncbi:hypothetical protein [Ferruginibacter sp.]|uniref:hypothetical protein n=1 Tax=Ferruginibacter sp. TaxID=1940288 RepID=UPI0019C47393|nr:hypothetical protein [Ferruginibacter sp.]MBC7629792.1 hypothetical protein [Ferruginibacter sp.]